MKMFL